MEIWTDNHECDNRMKWWHWLWHPDFTRMNLSSPEFRLIYGCEVFGVIRLFFIQMTPSFKLFCYIMCIPLWASFLSEITHFVVCSDLEIKRENSFEIHCLTKFDLNSGVGIFFSLPLSFSLNCRHLFLISLIWLSDQILCIRKWYLLLDHPVYRVSQK